MLGSESSRRNAVAMSIGWWYLRRLIRKRGTAAVTGFLAGEGLSFREPHKRHTLRWVLLGGLIAGAGVFWWRRRQGGGDDWGEWEPAAPDPFPSEPMRMPEPAPEPVAT
jgi:hypothetical protein